MLCPALLVQESAEDAGGPKSATLAFHQHLSAPYDSRIRREADGKNARQPKGECSRSLSASGVWQCDCDYVLN